MVSMEPVQLSPYPTTHHRLPSSRELVLTPIEIERLCAHATKGEVKPVDQWIQICKGSFRMDHVEERSLFPVDQPSPFIQAAHACQVKFLRHVLKRYSNAIPIDRAAKIQLPVTPHKAEMMIFYKPDIEEAKKHHYCTAVLAACTSRSDSGKHEVVKLLVEAGASVNTPECCGITPLHAALTYHHNSKLVKFLVDYGADTNATDDLGRTPLMIASGKQYRHRALLAITQLIKSGANVNAIDAAGWTALHYAASVGKNERVHRLLASGANPMFRHAPRAINGEPANTDRYIPCPLYLAAAKNNTGCGVTIYPTPDGGEVVEHLIEHPACPPVCKAEALLLLGASKFDLNREKSVCIEGLWSRAFAMLENHNIIVDYPPPIAGYGNRAEIQNASELCTMISGPLALDEVYYQCLMIRERCMGYADPTLVHSLFESAEHFMEKKKFCNAENLHHRAVEMKIHIARKFGYDIKATYFSDGEMALLTGNVIGFSNWVGNLLVLEHRPNYPRYLKLTLDIAEIHGNMYGFNVHTKIHVFFRSLAFLMNCWLLDSKCVDENGFHIGSDECEEIGLKLVEVFSRYGSIIGFLLCETSQLVDLYHEYGRNLNNGLQQNFLPVLSAFLRWGDVTQIDKPLQCCGQRQLHSAVLHAKDFEQHKPLVSLLLQFGAHCDAVNAAGQTARELCKSVEEEEELFPPPFPLLLACYASRSIVKYQIPYKDMNLPSCVKHSIALHDPNSFYDFKT